ncbi:hypothetical protein PsorP6_018249 [Peronosclerospora sorghi]|uniref:Uncharacterized protein n=1 Tax=Peronosclerospora sorghi TaxID=230839 RepID=A0ACC0WFH3_9STRA|nr:hypothetical protein PsorP6_018249 [Peronosclerospora sorghi]
MPFCSSRMVVCWWLSTWKKLELEWQEASKQGQQQLVKIADTVQKTTWDKRIQYCEHGIRVDYWADGRCAAERPRIVTGGSKDVNVLPNRAVMQLTWLSGTQLWELAHRCCVRLQKEVEKLAEIFSRMQLLLSDDKARVVDEIHPRERYGRRIANAFPTRDETDDGFERVCSEPFLLEMLTMYKHEVVAKSLIASDVLECFEHDTVTVYLASWQMQPHIDRQRLEELEALISGA